MERLAEAFKLALLSPVLTNFSKATPGCFSLAGWPEGKSVSSGATLVPSGDG